MKQELTHQHVAQDWNYMHMIGNKNIIVTLQT